MIPVSKLKLTAKCFVCFLMFWVSFSILFTSFVNGPFARWQFDNAQDGLREQFKTTHASNYPKYGDVFGKIRIPALKLNLMVKEGSGGNSFNSGPAHLFGSALPGQASNCVIGGYASAFTGPFRKLESLRTNDKIYITTHQGTFTYSVYVYDKTFFVEGLDPDPSSFGTNAKESEWVGHTSKTPILTLFTEYKNIIGDPMRRVVVARLEGVTQETVQPSSSYLKSLINKKLVVSHPVSQRDINNAGTQRYYVGTEVVLPDKVSDGLTEVRGPEEWAFGFSFLFVSLALVYFWWYRPRRALLYKKQAS